MDFYLCAYLHISLCIEVILSLFMSLCFLMYLVMDHMHCICYDFEHSSSIWSVTGRIIN